MASRADLDRPSRRHAAARSGPAPVAAIRRGGFPRSGRSPPRRTRASARSPTPRSSCIELDASGEPPPLSATFFTGASAASSRSCSSCASAQGRARRCLHARRRRHSPRRAQHVQLRRARDTQRGTAPARCPGIHARTCGGRRGGAPSCGAPAAAPTRSPRSAPPRPWRRRRCRAAAASSTLHRGVGSPRAQPGALGDVLRLAGRGCTARTLRSEVRPPRRPRRLRFGFRNRRVWFFRSRKTRRPTPSRRASRFYRRRLRRHEGVRRLGAPSHSEWERAKPPLAARRDRALHGQLVRGDFVAPVPSSRARRRDDGQHHRAQITHGAFRDARLRCFRVARARARRARARARSAPGSSHEAPRARRKASARRLHGRRLELAVRRGRVRHPPVSIAEPSVAKDAPCSSSSL